MGKTNMEKRVPKGEKKMYLSLNDEQREAKGLCYEKDIAVLLGKAGSGKTLVAAHSALTMFYKKQVNTIIVIRPMVTAGEEMGFLPGDIKDKIGPFLAPVFANIEDLVGKQELEKLEKDGSIEIVPIAFARGRTFRNSFILVDEAQNMTDSQIKLILSRLGVGSTIVLTGDAAQVDLVNKKLSGISRLVNLAKSGKSKYIGVYELKTNHRHEVVEDILAHYEDVA